MFLTNQFNQSPQHKLKRPPDWVAFLKNIDCVITIYNLLKYVILQVNEFFLLIIELLQINYYSKNPSIP
jgi:hypothetical protein